MPSPKNSSKASVRLTIWILLSVLGVQGPAWAGPLGQGGLCATYELAADPNDRPEFERKTKATVAELTLTLGQTENYKGKTYQWLELGFARLNGKHYRLWLLMDRLPNKDGTPRVARYIWSEPQWAKPLEYVDEVSGAALLPRWPLWIYGFAHGLPSSVDSVDQFPEQLGFQGYTFRKAATKQNAAVAVPDSKVLVIDTDKIIFTVDRFRYLVSIPENLPKDEPPYSKEKYRRLTEDDVREMMSVGVNLFSSHHAWSRLAPGKYGQIIDVWQESVWVYDHPFVPASVPGDLAYAWPEILYRSNFYLTCQHLNEPAILRAHVFDNKPDVVASWTPQQLAEDLQSHIKYMMSHQNEHWPSVWHTVKEHYGLGNLPTYQESVPSWEVAFETAWYQMAGQAGGMVKESDSLGSLDGLADINMAYGVEIPLTLHNIFAIHTAVLRGAARNFNKDWGVSVYGSGDAWRSLAGIEYAYRHGARHFWFWGGWPDIPDVDWPHVQKLHFMNETNTLAERYGPRDMPKLLQAAKVAIAIPYGYDMDPKGCGYMFRTHWMHAERKNSKGLKIGQILHNAYTEAERLLRKGIEFDFVVDDSRFTKTGYDEIIYIQEDGKVRVDCNGNSQLLDGPRQPSRLILGPGPTISARFGNKPQHLGEPAVVAISVQPGSSKLFGPLRATVYTPDGFAVNQLLPTTMTNPWTFKQTKVPGTYRLRFSTVDEFSRSAVTWLEFQLKSEPAKR